MILVFMFFIIEIGIWLMIVLFIRSCLFSFCGIKIFGMLMLVCIVFDIDFLWNIIFFFVCKLYVIMFSGI